MQETTKWFYKKGASHKFDSPEERAVTRHSHVVMYHPPILHELILQVNEQTPNRVQLKRQSTCS